MRDEMKKAFDQVHASKTLQEDTCSWLMEQRNKKNSFRFVRPALTIAVLCFALYWVFFLPVAYISVDVNPSIELTINRLDYVLHAEAFNEEGEKILNQLSLKNQSYQDAVDTLLNSAEMSPYLLPDSGLTITVAGDASCMAKIEEGLASCSTVQQHHGQMYSASVSSRRRAHACGMSFGKYRLYERLCENGEDLSVEECRNMNMRQLNQLLSKCEGRGNGGHGHHGGQD